MKRWGLLVTLFYAVVLVVLLLPATWIQATVPDRSGVGAAYLFSAVAVSGTASLYLAPVVFFSLWGGRRDIPVWSHVSAFALALGGAALYFLESSGHSAWLGEAHKYTKLLWISGGVLGGGCLLYWAGAALERTRRVRAAA